MLYSLISETFWRRHNSGDRRKMGDFQGLETNRDKQCVEDSWVGEPTKHGSTEVAII